MSNRNNSNSMETATLCSRKMLHMFPVVLGSLMVVGNISFASAADNFVVAEQQQVVSIKGQVVDAKGESLIGVNVLEKNTSNGTITDYDGNFTLNVSPGAVLVFSYIGYESKEVPASQAKKVVLKEDTKKLDEVVVIGYGAVKKADLAGSVAVLDNKNFKDQPVTRVADALQGRVAGV